jgi:hypothetical protein
MHRSRSFAAVVLAALFVAPAAGQPKDPNTDPGEMHKALAKRVGEYTSTTKFYLKPNEAMPETKGTAKVTSILGGRFVQVVNEGEMLGQKFTSIHIDGYNNGAQRFESTWIYTGGTSTMSLVGTSKDGGKTIVYDATYMHSKTDKHEMTITVTQTDDDHWTLKLVGKNPDGTPGPTMETVYTRKK